MKEEVYLTSDFTYLIAHVYDPAELKNAKVLQVRLIFILEPDIMEFSPGDDGDEVAFISLEKLKEIDEPKYDYLTMIMNNARWELSLCDESYLADFADQVYHHG